MENDSILTVSEPSLSSYTMSIGHSVAEPDKLEEEKRCSCSSYNENPDLSLWRSKTGNYKTKLLSQTGNCSCNKRRIQEYSTIGDSRQVVLGLAA